MRHGTHRSKSVTQTLRKTRDQGLKDMLFSIPSLQRCKMKPITCYWLPCLLLLYISSAAQKSSPLPTATAVRFAVAGACDGQCKPRIEAAAKLKGVKSAAWEAATGMLSLVYDSARVSMAKIQQRIVAAGHDVGSSKASDAVYNALPACCHYRSSTKTEDIRRVDTLQEDKAQAPPVKDSAANAGITVSGLVLEADSKGNFLPLQGASIVWLGTSSGSTTDAGGLFSIAMAAHTQRLVVSYAGYLPDTLLITETKDLKIVLGNGKRLKEVVVTSRQRSTYLLALSPVRTEVMTERELFKAACCNLSESFETNPSVDVSYNDAVTGSKQIQLLGLSGNYTQLTVENLPGPRGIATPLGLNAIAGPWIASIQLTKGVGAVANGFESIAGQINVELKKPENSEQLYANVYLNNTGKTDLNLNLSAKINSKWSTALLLHNDLLTNKNADGNHDGFRDLPTGNQLGIVQRWKFDNGKGWMTQFGIKVFKDRKTGGEAAFNAATDKNTTQHYGLGINTDRYEVFGKLGYVFPAKKYKSIGLQLSATDHTQEAYFGLTTYNAHQQNLYANLIYQSVINNTNHKFRTGVGFVYDQYNEDLSANNYRRTETVPGAFFEYTWTVSEKISAVAGIRADYNNLSGFFMTPRLHLRYEPVKGTTLRLSAGRGQRTANIFAENTSALVSARQVNIIGAVPGKAYGLNPEVAWNKGISVDQQFKVFYREASFSLDFFRNDFTQQVVTDLENARQVKFYNLQGRSYSNSFQAALTIAPLKNVEMVIAYRYFDVKTNYGGQLLQRPLVAAHRGFINLAYALHGWKFDYTFNSNGRKRIPNTSENPEGYRLDSYSPAFIVMNTAVSKTLGRKHPMDIYVGAENLGNYMQPQPVISASQPFGPYFDASLVWGPVNGRMLFIGWRYKIK